MRIHLSGRPLGWASLLLGLLAAGPVWGDDNWLSRTWTNDEGKEIVATFLRTTETVAMLNHDGKVVRAPLAKLSQADRDWIEALKSLRKARDWKLQDGRVMMKARLVDVRGDMVQLKVKAEEHIVALADLSSADRSRVEMVVSGMSASDLKDFRPREVVTREWTDVEGKTIVAEFRGTEGDKIVLYFKEKEWRVPLWRFSEADRAFVALAKNPPPDTNRAIASNRGYSPPSASPRYTPSQAAADHQARVEQMLRESRERMAATPPPSRFPSHTSPSSEHHDRSGGHAGPRYEHPTYTSPTHTRHEAPTLEYQRVYRCSRCGYDNPAATFKAGDKCGGCRKQIDVLRNDDGSVQSESTRSTGRRVRNMIFGGLFLASLIGGLIKKLSG